MFTIRYILISFFLLFLKFHSFGEILKYVIKSDKKIRPLVLVTGASGFVAGHCIRELTKKGYKVRGTVRNKKEKEKYVHLLNINPDIEIVEADLLRDEGWSKAIKGVTYVLHTASPFPINVNPDNPEEIILPAVEGTKRVLNLCINTSSVKRIVITSSAAAITNSKKPNGYIYTHTDWSDYDESQSAYVRSKVSAEKLAWETIKEANNKNNKQIDLVVINPQTIIGPLLNSKRCTSSKLISKFLNREYPRCINLYFGLVDVRDVAFVHVRALEIEDAHNKRFILSSGEMCMDEIGGVLKKAFGKYGYNPPIKSFPKWIVILLCIFNKEIRGIYNDIGVRKILDSKSASNFFQFEYINPKESLVEMGHSLIKYNHVKIKPKYKKLVSNI